jgi:argininosuccinate lyase
MADYLVGKGSSFRQAHEIVAGLVKYAEGKSKGLRSLSIEEYQKFSDLFDKDICDISVEKSIAARNIPGGTAQEQVEKALKKAREILDDRQKRD